MERSIIREPHWLVNHWSTIAENWEVVMSRLTRNLKSSLHMGRKSRKIVNNLPAQLPMDNIP